MWKSALFFLIILSSCSIGRLEKLEVYKELPPSLYLPYVQDSSINLIDVRTEAEYAKSHIEGAINISYFGGHFREELKEKALDKSLPTLIYCETQHRSLFVAKKMYRMGFRNVIDLDRGMMYWRKNAFPYHQAELPAE